MASVTVDDVRDVINISSADVPDAKIFEDAETWGGSKAWEPFQNKRAHS